MQHYRHIPSHYVGGAYIKQTEVWLGEFIATSNELYEYAINDVQSVEEYDMVTTMVIAQQVYELWWDRVKNENRS